MADFIAVIRRAVDGLSENTPEMRAKVYERAKSAVVRQLENMKPRPPEAMFQRQIDKLDAAIREVEAEHAEAGPADDVPAAATEEPKKPAPAAEPVVAAAVEAKPADISVREPAPEPAPVIERELVPESLIVPTQARRQEPAKAPPAPEPASTPPVEIAPTPVAASVEAPDPGRVFEAEPAIPAYVTSDAAAAEPEAKLAPEAHPVQLDVKPYEAAPEIGKPDLAAYEAAPAEAYVAPAEPVYEPVIQPAAEAKPALEEDPVPVPLPVQQTIESELAAKRPVAEENRQRSADVDAALQVADARPAAVEPPPMPKVSYDETDVVAGFNDFLKEELNRKVVPPPPQAKAKKQDDFSWDAPFDDLPEIPKPETFEKALEAKQKEIAGDKKGNGNGKNKQPKAEPISARAELETMLGIEPAQRRPAQADADAGALPPDVSRAVSKLEGKSFKMQKKKKARSRLRLLPVALAVAGVLVLAGGAYALWHYKDDVSQLVASLMPAGDAKKPADAKSADVKSEATQPAVKRDVKTETAQAKDAAKQPTEVASLNNDVGPQKFTQRLLPNGTETDTDAARVPIDQALKEGKSVAGQTEKGKEVAETTATDAKSDATSTNTAAPQDDAQPLGATQKMFLYEERLGQSSPVAVPGTVVWKEKADTEDGKPDPAIEASISIPSRKITALITFKRNTDPSLPASHIIEIVFALPKDFEEGNVDSIQRVAFKQTEQDRGNPLIAVPAKITDDFHMVALNDDADARKVNLELMKTRGWIDIPITYRNGRRALITLEKGATGTAVFDKVMGEWDALGAQTSNNN